MDLQTKIPLGRAKASIDYEGKLLLLGSCFAEHIADKLYYHRFQLISNPFGILFHSIAIENLLQRSLSGQRYTENELFYLNEAWHSFDAHSDLSKTSNDETLKELNTGLEKTRAQLLEATHVIITFGTAWVYRNKESKRIVANCHKVPQKEFTKELLSVDTLHESLNTILETIKLANENAAVIFTVSPVRHLKDGFVENTRSKAHLITAIHQLTHNERVYYFPSYELVMDELRDYRFYAKDMIHPNEVAVDYIWERFKETWIDPHIYPVMEAVNEVQKGLAHRPFNPDSENHQLFLKNLDSKMHKLRSEYPHMDFGS